LQNDDNQLAGFRGFVIVQQRDTQTDDINNSQDNVQNEVSFVQVRLLDAQNN